MKGAPGARRVQRGVQRERIDAEVVRGAKKILEKEVRAVPLLVEEEALEQKRALKEERGEVTAPALVVRLAEETARRVGEAGARGARVQRAAEAPVAKVQMVEGAGGVEAAALRSIERDDVPRPLVAMGAGATAPGLEALEDASSVLEDLGAPFGVSEMTMGGTEGGSSDAEKETETGNGGRLRGGVVAAAIDREGMRAGLRHQEEEEGTVRWGEVVGALLLQELVAKIRLQGAQQRVLGPARSCFAASGKRSCVEKRWRRLGETT